MKPALFLCTANACRSQIAEGIARVLLPPGAFVCSGGTKPCSPDPRALGVLGELGIDTTGMHSKLLRKVPVDHIGTVITLCDSGHRIEPSMAVRFAALLARKTAPAGTSVGVAV